MEEQFEYGELVEVRDGNEEWKKKTYVNTMIQPPPHPTLYFTMPLQQNVDDYEGLPVRWKQIRKIQKPEPGLIDIEQPETIEQRMDKFEAIFNGAIKNINEQIKSIKKQLK